MTAATPPFRSVATDRARRMRAFTILELLVAMGIFSVLGTMAVWFMRQSLDIFYAGTRESAVFDRLDSGLPRLRADLESLYVGDRFTPPPPPPTGEQLLAGAQAPPPPPPPAVQLRSGFITLRDATGALKETPMFYMAFVVALGDEWADDQLRRGGAEIVPEPKAFTPETIDESATELVFRPPGGLMEVLWIAVPDDADHPETLTLYRGFRSPVGDLENTLLDPTHFDSLAKIRKVARPVLTGVLHFGAVWRRSFAPSWDETSTIGFASDETAPYVGRVWDSTRGFDTKFPLTKGEASRIDASDDIFPAFVRLELTLQSEGTFGYTRGDVMLADSADASDFKIRVAETDSFFAPALGRDTLWLKIGTEWMTYSRSTIDIGAREVRVNRGQRGTKGVVHPALSWIHLGTPVQTEMELVFRDRFAVRGKGR
ncbi:MAG: type II secretion system protein [Planctomycetota bacterium]